jgi:hypothetical protein
MSASCPIGGGNDERFQAAFYGKTSAESGENVNQSLHKDRGDGNRERRGECRLTEERAVAGDEARGGREVPLSA